MRNNLSLPFSVYESFTLEPLARIHCDIWGPSPIESLQNFIYYVVILDDFSRFNWFYPLRFKSDFYGIFLLFQSHVENQFNKKIEVFQSDGGSEFTSNQFKAQLIKCGIKHQIYCPHTPQQNDLTERKHRHLTELSLSMMFHSHVPLRYWVKKFYTANYLCNLLLSISLEVSNAF